MVDKEPLCGCATAELLSTYLFRIKNKKGKNIEKNYNYIDKNHIEILTYLALLLNCVVLLLNTKLEKGWRT